MKTVGFTIHYELDVLISYFSITHYGVVSLNDSVFIIGGNCDAYYTSYIAKVRFSRYCIVYDFNSGDSDVDE